MALQHVAPGESPGLHLSADHFYSQTNIWTVHLSFAPEQWEAMEPPDRGRSESLPGASGARSLAPVIMSQGDANRDGRASPGELERPARAWVQGWDPDGSGHLDGDQIRAGLDAIRNPAGGGIATMSLGAEGQRNGIAVALGLRYTYVPADLEFEGRLFSNVGVRYKGNGTSMTSCDSLKRPLKIALNKYAKGQSLGDIRRLTLQNNVTNPFEVTEVYVRQDGTWMLASMSFTRLMTR